MRFLRSWEMRLPHFCQSTSSSTSISTLSLIFHLKQRLDLVHTLDALGEGMDLALDEHVEAHVQVAEEVAAGELVLGEHG